MPRPPRASFPSCARYEAGTEGLSLAESYHIRGATPGLVEEKTVRRLQRDVQAQPELKTGIISVSVTAPSAELAQALNQRLLDLLNEFNLQTRQSQARAERAFAERRLAEVKDSLRAAEHRLQEFFQQNRDFSNSPALTFRQERLAREVTLQQQIFQTLAQGYEQAKLEEVRDIPVITIVEHPSLAPRADSRGLVKRAILGAFLGVVATLLLAMGREARAALAAAHGEEYDELRTLGAASASEARALWGRIRRFGRRDPQGP